MAMETKFFTFLTTNGVKKKTIKALEDEGVDCSDIFFALNDSHFCKLLNYVCVGQHALLLQLWRKNSPRVSISPSRSPVSDKRSSTPSSSSSLSSPRSSLPRKSFSPQPDDSVRDSIKELADMYKKNRTGAMSASGETKNNKSLRGGDPRQMTIILGGMLYCASSGKGYRRQSIPGPNPQKIDMPRKSSLNDLFKKAQELYFGSKANLSHMDLSDSSGVVIKVDKTSWMLENYYKENNFQPSRHKLYIIYDSDSDVSEIEVFGDEESVEEENTQQTSSKADEHKEENTQQTSSKADEHVHSKVPVRERDEIYTHGYTLPFITSCAECSRPYRTYEPNTDCLLHDGSIETHTEPQLVCPSCDPGKYGLFMNADLFPELVFN